MLNLPTRLPAHAPTHSQSLFQANGGCRPPRRLARRAPALIAYRGTAESENLWVAGFEHPESDSAFAADLNKTHFC